MSDTEFDPRPYASVLDDREDHAPGDEPIEDTGHWVLNANIGLASRGITPQRSGFLSAFFGLVGLHGLHVTLAGVWLATMLAQVQVKGFRPEIVHRLICFNLFWHALDIVWIGIFTIVYLVGAIT